MIARIIFEENDKVILEKQVTLSEDKYPDGKRMLMDSFAFDMPEMLNEVENIINNGEPKF